ncbi:DUF6498-containing protein (plasmid) [Haloarcula sp. NS06]|uniref:DUF6498-containing protein n=1 Tax=Haloarcula sp. NS06 TaxID=3409688 RepID=UPI003DA78705
MNNDMSLRSSLPDAKLVSVFVANGVPVTGLLVFGTSATALLVFYWLELGVAMLWAVVRATFAGKLPSEETDREPFSSSQWPILHVILSNRFFEDSDENATSNNGSWREWQIPVPRTEVGIYLGTIPALAIIIFLLSVVWAGFGGVVAGPIVAATETADTPMWPLTGAGVVFLSEGWQTATDYFYRGGYCKKSVWTAARGVFYRGLVIVAIGLLVLLTVRESIEGNQSALRVQPVAHCYSLCSPPNS